jgi:hypothetical protein
MISQLALGILGVIAIYLSQDSRVSVRRFACLFGLAAQPFWFYATYVAEQWGIFALCALYTLSWLKGVRTHWMKPS